MGSGPKFENEPSSETGVEDEPVGGVLVIYRTAAGGESSEFFPGARQKSTLQYGVLEVWVDEEQVIAMMGVVGYSVDYTTR